MNEVKTTIGENDLISFDAPGIELAKQIREAMYFLRGSHKRCSGVQVFLCSGYGAKVKNYPSLTLEHMNT